MDPIERTMMIGKKISGAFKKDTWQNIFTGLGMAGDKRTGGRIVRTRITQNEAETLHDSDDLAKLAINEVPDRGTSKWITHSVGENDGGIEMAKKLVEEEKRLSVRKKVRQAWKWGRLYGGAAIFISVEDGLDLSEPLNFNRIYKFNSLTVLHRHELHRGELTDDINDPNFGLPEYYTISGRTAIDMPKIHHSRFIRFGGSPLSEQEFKNNDYWDDSVLTVLKEILRDYNAAYSGVANAMHDFDVSVLKLNNLSEIIGSDEDDLVIGRLKLMNLAKSVLGSILIDSENESFETMSRQFTNVDKVLEKLDQRLVMGMRMPHTVVLGNGSTGTLGAGGESESNNMNALVSAQQEEILEEPIDLINKVTQSAKNGPTNGNVLKSHSWVFNPLSEPGEKEVAETRKLVAETDEIYYGISVLSSQEIADSRFGGDEYSIETAINNEARKEQEETDLIGPEETKKIMKTEKE